MEDFYGTVCFVTGGSRGIGKAIVEAFHAAGAKVAFCDIEPPEKPLEGTIFKQLDVRNTLALQEFMTEVYTTLGNIDILVNNAGVSTFSPLTETSVEQFDSIIATNLRPVFVTSRQMALLRQNESGPDENGNRSIAPEYGRIINIASTRWLQSEPGTEGYSASKGGIVSLTHALAVSLAGTGITVNCISPGWINTGHWGELSCADHAQHPSGRAGTPKDIARACTFIAAPGNNFINGANIVIDGGMTRKMIYTE